MIKFGSRTELYIPKRLEPSVLVQVGAKVQGGMQILATVSRPISIPAPDMTGRPAAAPGTPIITSSLPLD
jgi:hypothetical protein